MRNKDAEKQRIKELEELRTPQNSHVIDAAIADGRSAGIAAMEIVRAGLCLSEKEIQDAMVADVVNEANRLVGAKQLKGVASRQAAASTGDPEADAVFAEIQKQLNARK